MTLREKAKEIDPEKFEELNEKSETHFTYCPCAFGLPDDCEDGRGNCTNCWTKEYTEESIAPEEDLVNRPAHYTDGKIEVIEYIEDKKLGFCLGNAIKYISRAGKKNPDKEIEDLLKAKWYIERRIKELEEARE